MFLAETVDEMKPLLKQYTVFTVQLKPIEKIVNNKGLPVGINRFFLQWRSGENGGLSKAENRLSLMGHVPLNHKLFWKKGYAVGKRALEVSGKSFKF